MKNESCNSIEMKDVIVSLVTDPTSEKKNRVEKIVGEGVFEKYKNKNEREK